MEALVTLLAGNLLMIMILMIALWLVSIPLGDVSFIDSFWALGMVIVAASSYLMTDGAVARKTLLLGITTIWGVRLGLHLLLRWRREGADRRYLALLAKAPGNPHFFSLRKVFLTQGPLLWLVTLPVQLGQIDAAPATLGSLAVAGAAVAALGIVFETVGDWQLSRFRTDPANAGLVMDRGLWRYTRHPNYFGDSCVWWGLYLIAAETQSGVWALISPVFLTFILIKWSGAALLERRLKRSRPGYAEYINRTSGFLPWPPRKS